VKRWFTVADVLTVLRLPLAAAFLLVAAPAWRLAIVAAAALSDFLDGRLARRLGPSRVGVVLDPVADKLFMLAAFLAVAHQNLLTWWEIALVLSRDIVAALAAGAVWVLGRPLTLPARAGGKAVTVCQLLTLVAFIAQSPLVRPLAWATAAISMYAIWDYGRAATRVVHHTP
jgi:phosphatidylglycerophosphate synthase